MAQEVVKNADMFTIQLSPMIHGVRIKADENETYSTAVE